MDPVTLGLLIGGSTGLLKSQLIDAPKEARQRELQAQTARYSPWTGLKPSAVEEADPFGNMVGYGFSGAQMGQGLGTYNAAKDKGTLGTAGGPKMNFDYVYPDSPEAKAHQTLVASFRNAMAQRG